MTAGSRRERVLRDVAVRLAAEIDEPVHVVHARLAEAVAAGLLRITRTGVEACVPDDDR